jgi:hypothetical protein
VFKRTLNQAALLQYPRQVCYFQFRSLRKQDAIEVLAGNNRCAFSPELLDKALKQPFKDEAQTALFKDPVRTAQ